MKIFVKAKTGSKENNVAPPRLKLWDTNEKQDEYYTVCVKERPVQGRANIAITKALAEYFEISISNVRLVSGMTSKKKNF